MKLIKCVFFLVILTSLSLNAKGSWENLQPVDPQGYRLNTIAEISNDSLWFAGERIIMKYTSSGFEKFVLRQEDWILDIYSANENQAFAVGYNGLITQFDGTQWIPQRPLTYQTISSIWGSSGESVFAAGYQGILLHYDGTAWSLMTPPETKYDYYDIWGRNDDDLYLAAGSGTNEPSAYIFHRNGNAWEKSLIMENSICEKIWEAGDGAIYILVKKFDVSSYRYYVIKWDSETNQEILSSAGYDLSSIHSVFPISETEFYILTDDLLLFYDSSSFTAIDYPPDEALAIWGSSTDNLFVCGDDSRIYHGSNTGPWDLLYSEVPLDITCGWTSSTDDIFTGTSGNAVLQRVNGQWNTYLLDSETSINCIFGFAADDVYCGGDQLWHWDGLNWTVELTNLDNSINGIWGPEPGVLYVVGDEGMLLVTQGGEWQQVEFTYTQDLYSIWGLSQDEFFIGGNNILISYSNDHYSAMTYYQKNYYSIWGTAADDVYAAGTNLLHYDGTTWSSINLNESLEDFKTIRGICENSDGLLFIQDFKDIASMNDEEVWFYTLGSGYPRLNTLFSGPDHKVYAGGDDGVLLQWNQFSKRTFIRLPATHIGYLDPFWTKVYLESDEVNPMTKMPLVIALEAYGEFFFWPDWSQYNANTGEGFDFMRGTVNHGIKEITAITSSIWMERESWARDLYFYAALLTEDQSSLLGDMSMLRWEYGPN